MQEEIRAIFDVVKRLNDAEVNFFRERNANANCRARNFACLMVGAFIIALLMGLAYYFWKDCKWFGLLSLGFLIATYALATIYFLWEIWVNQHSLQDIFKNPFDWFYQDVKSGAILDAQFLENLRNKNSESLVFVRLQLESQRHAFTQRIGLIIGSMDKAGILLGILVLVVLLEKLNSSGDWVYIVAYTIPPLQFISIGAHMFLHRVERIIAILDYVIAYKNEEEN